MKILYTDLKVKRQELDSEFFKDFNWGNFEFGDIVWLEDNDEVPMPAATYLGVTSDQAINLRGVSYREANSIYAIQSA